MTLETHIKVPNKGLAQFLKSDAQLAATLMGIATVTAGMWQGIVARRSETLANSIEVSESSSMGYSKDRLGVRIDVNAPYAAAHEFGFTNNWGTYRGGHEWQLVLSTLSTG